MNTKNPTHSSINRIGKITALVYLVLILGGIFGQGYVINSMVVMADANLTAFNVRENTTLFYLGYAITLIEMLCQLALAPLFYLLLKPVDSKLALTAAVFGIAGAIIKTLSNLFFIVPIYILTEAQYLSSFTNEQINSIALLLFDIKNYGSTIALVFLGVFSLLTGYLMVKSVFIPKVLGYFSLVGGFGWLSFMYPPVGFAAFPVVALISVLGVVAFVVWFLWHGVDEAKWAMLPEVNG